MPSLIRQFKSLIKNLEIVKCDKIFPPLSFDRDLKNMINKVFLPGWYRQTGLGYRIENK